MIEPKEFEIEVPLPGGGTENKTFILSKFPAVAGREIITQYPISGIPKIGDYDTNEIIMMKILSYVSVPMPDAAPLPLTSRALIDNHVPNWEILARIEWAMMEYNCSFFRDGKVSNFLDDLLANLPASILSILTPLLEQLSPKNSQPSES